MRGRTANSATKPVIIRGTRKSPQNFDMEPLASPAAFQCDTILSGAAGYTAMVRAKVIMRPAIIANLMSFTHRYWELIR
jgi:hypothetical protein